MINALVAALEGFHHISPEALIQEEVDRYCIEQHMFTCACTMIVCLQDWRSEGDTGREIIKKVSIYMYMMMSSMSNCNWLPCAFGNWVLGYTSTRYDAKSTETLHTFLDCTSL